jgi:hypothetical protein
MVMVVAALAVLATLAVLVKDEFENIFLFGVVVVDSLFVVSGTVFDLCE